MASANVYVTRRIPDPGLDLLRQAGIQFDMNSDDRVLDYDELVAAVRGRDAVLCLLTDTIDAGVLDAAKGAKIFANYAVGFNNIDVKAASERGVLVSNTPGVLTEDDGRHGVVTPHGHRTAHRRGRYLHPRGQVPRLGPDDAPRHRRLRRHARHRRTGDASAPPSPVARRGSA